MKFEKKEFKVEEKPKFKFISKDSKVCDSCKHKLPKVLDKGICPTCKRRTG